MSSSEDDGEEAEVIEVIEDDELPLESGYEGNVARAKFIFNLRDEEGHLEAPINLNISDMSRIELNPLMWYNHDVPPKKIKLTNTGSTVILTGKWHGQNPYLSEGPFLGKYIFSQLHFHWGENEMVGSEHYLDGCCMPMELHCLHFKEEFGSQEAALQARDGLAILVYLFKLKPSANPVFTELLEALSQIRDPGSSVTLRIKLKISDIMRPFSNDFFLYWGALNYLGTSTSVIWIVTREPIGISQEQITQFRTLHNCHHNPLLGNCHALQERQNRSVFHVNPSGKSAYSLLPIPWEPPLVDINQSTQSVKEESNNDSLECKAQASNQAKDV